MSESTTAESSARRSPRWPRRSAAASHAAQLGLVCLGLVKAGAQDGLGEAIRERREVAVERAGLDQVVAQRAQEGRRRAGLGQERGELALHAPQLEVHLGGEVIVLAGGLEGAAQHLPLFFTQEDVVGAQIALDVAQGEAEREVAAVDELDLAIERAHLRERKGQHRAEGQQHRRKGQEDLGGQREAQSHPQVRSARGPLFV
jgi:hypothetical protein